MTRGSIILQKVLQTRLAPLDFFLIWYPYLNLSKPEKRTFQNKK